MSVTVLREVNPFLREESGESGTLSSRCQHGVERARRCSRRPSRRSKGGVIGLTRSLARELGEYNITVNAIAPGLTISMDEVDAARDTQNQQRLQARSIKRTELPQDVVGAAVFLCAAESDFITGQTLVVDGGAQRH